MPFRFTGDSVLLYTQYIDADTGRTLEASPAGPGHDAVYAMTPAGGLDLPVPPGDGRWESAGPPGGDGDGDPGGDGDGDPGGEPAAGDGGQDPAVPLMTGTEHPEEQ